MLTLNVQERDLKQSAKALRKEGKIPCVYYGPKDKPVAILADKVEFSKILRDAGESTVVALKTPKTTVEALIHDVSYDPVSSEIIHADFYVPEKGKKVEVEVPLEFIGVSAAIKDFGGTLVKVLHEIEIEALPADLPHSIKVDISALADLESQIAAKDIVLPKGVTLITEPEEVVASISKAEEEKAGTATGDVAEIEIVEKKGKKEEEGEGKK